MYKDVQTDGAVDIIKVSNYTNNSPYQAVYFGNLPFRLFNGNTNQSTASILFVAVCAVQVSFTP